MLNARSGRPCPSPGARDRLICLDHAGRYDLQDTHASLEVQRTHYGLQLTSISGWEDYQTQRVFDADQLAIPLVVGTGRQQGRGFSQEFRVASADSAERWMAGLFYLHGRFREGSPEQASVTLGPAAASFRLPSGTGIGQPGDRGYHDARSSTRHVSAFAQASLPFADGYRLTTGVRWLSERKVATIHNAADPPTPGLISLVLFPTAANGVLSRSSKAFTWNIAGQYKPRDNLLTYLSLSRGFKSGGFNIGLGATPVEEREFGDEKATSLEIGARGRSANQRIFWNLVLFRARYDDFQSAGWVSLRFQVNNAERVTVRGAELDLDAVITERLRGTFSLSRASARYDRYTGGSCHFARVPDNADGTGCDLSGHGLPLAPKWIASLGLQYRKATRFGHGFVRMHWRWTDRYFTNATLDPRNVQASHSLVDLRVGVEWDRFELIAWVRNALDEWVIMQEGPSNLFAVDPAYASFMAPPRSVGLSLRARW